MPRTLAIDNDDTPAPRRGGGSAAFAAAGRSALLRLVLRNPRDAAAAAIAAAAVVTIVVNAVFLQAGRHPAPMFAAPIAAPVASAPAATAAAPSVSAAPSSPMPRPRPADGQASAPAVAAPARPRSADPLANLIVASQRVAAVQRALTDYGYGQIKPTGAIGPETQAAIQRFERERKLPITGQMSERLVRELGLATGRTIE